MTQNAIFLTFKGLFCLYDQAAYMTWEDKHHKQSPRGRHSLFLVGHSFQFTSTLGWDVTAFFKTQKLFMRFKSKYSLELAGFICNKASGDIDRVFSNPACALTFLQLPKSQFCFIASQNGIPKLLWLTYVFGHVGVNFSCNLTRLRYKSFGMRMFQAFSMQHIVQTSVSAAMSHAAGFFQTHKAFRSPPSTGIWWQMLSFLLQCSFNSELLNYVVDSIFSFMPFPTFVSFPWAVLGNGPFTELHWAIFLTRNQMPQSTNLEPV